MTAFNNPLERSLSDDGPVESLRTATFENNMESSTSGGTTKVPPAPSTANSIERNNAQTDDTFDAEPASPLPVSTVSLVFESPSSTSEVFEPTEAKAGATTTKADAAAPADRGEKHTGHWGPWSVHAAGAGCLTGINSFVDSLAIGGILFSGEFSSLHVDIGVKHALVGCVVAQLINGCYSGYSKLITPNGWELLPFIMPLFRKIEPEMIVDGLSPEEVVTTLLWVSAVVPLMSCGMLTLLGMFRLGDLLNFVPSTVRIGLFACIGYSLWASGFDVSCGKSFDLSVLATSPSELAWMWKPDMMLKWAIPQGLGVVLYVAASRSSDKWSARIFPLYLVCGIAVFNLIFAANGWSVDEAAEEGWLMEGVDAGTPIALYNAMWSFDKLHMKYISENFGDLVIAACLGPVLNVGIKTKLMQPMLKERIGLNDELLLNGKSMLLVGLLGGFPAYAALGNTTLHIHAGGNTRWSTVLAGCVTASFFLIPSMVGIVRIIPNVLIGGLFVNYGLQFMSGAVREFYRIKKIESVLVWGMVIVSIVSSFSHATFSGIIGGFAIFIYQYSLVNNVLLESYLNILLSHTERTMKQEQSLQVTGSSVFILRLSGYLYFATVVDIAESVRQRIGKHRHGVEQGASAICIRQVVLDFEGVPNLDTSALLSICNLCEDLHLELGVQRIHFTGFNQDGRYKRLHRMLENSRCDLGDGCIVFHGDFDEALSTLEDQLLQKFTGSTGRKLTLLRDICLQPIARCRLIMQAFAEWIGANRQLCGDAGCLWQFVLLGCCERQLISKGEVLAQVGETGKGVWLLLKGTIVGTVSVDFRSGTGTLERLWSNRDGPSVHDEIIQQWSGNGLLVGTSGIHARKQYAVSHSAATDCDVFYVSCEHIAQMQTAGAHQALAALHCIALTYSSRSVRWLQRSRLSMEAQTKGVQVVEQLHFG